MKELTLSGFISLLLIVALIFNIMLFAMGNISVTIFWAVILFSALMAYFVIPRLTF